MTCLDTPQALDDIRVLELGGERPQYCGKLLADLGADVIRIEPPGGDAARRIGPFEHADTQRERSLHFCYFNTSKRSVVLDLAREPGRELFRALARTADVIVESHAPGYLDRIGIGYNTLAADNHRLVMTSITGFGQTGPHAHYAAPDIVPVAMSGMMFLAGFADDPPNRPYGEQGNYCAGIWGAIGTLCALHHRFHTGRGQRVDVSVQEALALNQETAMQTWDLQRELRGRFGDERMIPAFKSLHFPGFGTYRCRNGHIMAMMSILSGGGWHVIVDWMNESGMAQELTSEAWRPFISELGLRELVQKLDSVDATGQQEINRKLHRIDEILQAFFLAKDKHDLYEEGQARDLVLAPINSPKDLLESRQLNARGFFQPVQDDTGRIVRYPGHPYRHSLTPARIRQRPPLAGEHNREIYLDELRLGQSRFDALCAAGVV